MVINITIIVIIIMMIMVIIIIKGWLLLLVLLPLLLRTITFAGALEEMSPGVPLKGLRGGRVQFLGLFGARSQRAQGAP